MHSDSCKHAGRTQASYINKAPHTYEVFCIYIIDNSYFLYYSMHTLTTTGGSVSKKQSYYRFAFEPSISCFAFVDLFEKFLLQEDPERNKYVDVVVPVPSEGRHEGGASYFYVSGTRYSYIKLLDHREYYVIGNHGEFADQVTTVVGAFTKYLDAQGLVYTVR